MRLCIDASNIRSGGGLTHLIEVLRNADPAAHGFDQVFVWASRATLDALEERPWLVKRTEPVLETHYLRRALWQRNRLGDLARRDDCDVLFVPGGSFATSFKPVVTMSRNILPFEYRELRRYGLSAQTLRLLLLRLAQSRSFRRADGLIFLTQYARKAVTRVTGELPGRTAIVPHGVDQRFLVAPREARDIGSYGAANPFRLVYVSIVDVYKHHVSVVEAVAQLRARGVPVVLEMIGPAYAPAMRRLRAALERRDPRGEFAQYLGPLPYPELHLAYARADAVVYASSCENMPNILLEGMASGLATASSDRGPMPEVLADGGVYFDPEDPDSIANALTTLTGSADLRDRLATAAFERASGNSWRTCADRTFAFLAEAARSRAAAHPPATGVGGEGLRKLLRFLRIYGFGHTLFKAAGRLRISLPPLRLRSSPRDVGMIGCGQFAFATISYFLQRRFGRRVAACFDIDATARATFARAMRVPMVCENVADLFSNPDLRLVYIASNHATHTPYAVQALARGLDVYVEKPISVTHAQLLDLLRAKRASRGRIFAGYNRPFSAAIRQLRGLVRMNPGAGITLNCVITGHALAPDHWYRKPDEGTRICGNIGHWLDLMVHVQAWRGLPDKLSISLAWANDAERDDNVTISITSDREDLFGVTLSSRAEPFEGINETICFQHEDVICKIDDFRRMTVWQGARLVRKKYWPKDVGHRMAVMQPFRTDIGRDWEEVVQSTLLMLHITEMVRSGTRYSEFSQRESYRALLREVETE
jgi:predicted dehydrogenase/glycosyltransferase involved in cell wall biosynthesis